MWILARILLIDIEKCQILDSETVCFQLTTLLDTLNKNNFGSKEITLGFFLIFQQKNKTLVRKLSFDQNYLSFLFKLQIGKRMFFYQQKNNFPNLWFEIAHATYEMG